MDNREDFGDGQQGNAQRSVETQRVVTEPTVEENTGTSGVDEEEPSTRDAPEQPAQPEETRSRRRHVRSLAAMINTRGVTVTFAHASLGLIMIAVGCIVRAPVVFEPKLHRVPPASHLELNSVTTPKPQRTANIESRAGYGYFMLPPINYPNLYSASSEEYRCQAVTCSPHLSLICIAVGCVFLFCAFSGALMVYHKMKAYVCCHLVWVSISALCSITVSAACMMGLKIAYELSKNLAACACILVVMTLLEIVFCALDIFNVSNYFSPGLDLPREHARGSLRIGVEDTTASVEDGRGASVRLRAGGSDQIHSRRNQSGRSESTFLRGDSRHVQRRSVTIDIRRERNDQNHGRSSRPRGSRPGVRDRNLLHPGYQQHTRHRGRRRTILRAQNHYVLVPAPVGRPRVFSRGRAVNERRNRGEMPMFVIPDHDGYIRALNQSMETLETEFNRGSVPSDVLPSSPSYNQDNSTQAKHVVNSEIEAASRDDQTALPSSSASLQTESENKESIAGATETEKAVNRGAPMYTVEDSVDGASVNVKREGREGAVYSIVKRSKEGISKHGRGENEFTEDHAQAVESNSLPRLQNILARKLSQAAAAMLDGNEQPHLKEETDDINLEGQACSPPIPDIKSNKMHDEVRYNPGQLYNTSSEGDFSTISNESSSTPTHDRTFLVSVSSDSGVGECSATTGPKLAPRGTTPRYCNVPLYGSQRASLELSSLGASNLLYPFPPVSPRTPAYENVELESTSSDQKDNEDETAFSFLHSRELYKSSDE